MNEIIRNIQERRTIKPLAMNGEKIDDEKVMLCLEAAHWAPNHGRTEPWRFIVYTDTALEDFCSLHAEMYKLYTPEASYVDSKYNSIKHQYQQVSHLVVAIMQRTPMTKIPFLEEYAAVAASVQNLMLAAKSLDIATIWSTGGMILKPQMKDYFGLAEEDEILGFVLMGKVDYYPNSGVRKVAYTDKVKWNK